MRAHARTHVLMHTRTPTRTHNAHTHVRRTLTTLLTTTAIVQSSDNGNGLLLIIVAVVMYPSTKQREQMTEATSINFNSVGFLVKLVFVRDLCSNHRNMVQHTEP